MNLEYYELLEITDIEDLWSQNVNMDDWDFVVITFDTNQFEEVEKELEDGKIEKEILPTSWTLSNLFNRATCCGTEWYRISWKGKPAVIGVSYHS